MRHKTWSGPRELLSGPISWLIRITSTDHKHINKMQMLSTAGVRAQVGVEDEVGVEARPDALDR